LKRTETFDDEFSNLTKDIKTIKRPLRRVEEKLAGWWAKRPVRLIFQGLLPTFCPSGEPSLKSRSLPGLRAINHEQ